MAVSEPQCLPELRWAYCTAGCEGWHGSGGCEGWGEEAGPGKHKFLILSPWSPRAAIL